jgi:hypothetical protein
VFSVIFVLLAIVSLASWVLVWVEAALLWRFNRRHFALGPKICEKVATLETGSSAAHLASTVADAMPEVATKEIGADLVLLRAQGARSWPYLPLIWSPRMVLSSEKSDERVVLRLICRHAAAWPTVLACPALVMTLGLLTNLSAGLGAGLAPFWLFSLLLATIPLTLSLRAAHRQCCTVWRAVMQHTTEAGDTHPVLPAS